MNITYKRSAYVYILSISILRVDKSSVDLYSVSPGITMVSDEILMVRLLGVNTYIYTLMYLSKEIENTLSHKLKGRFVAESLGGICSRFGVTFSNLQFMRICKE